MVVIGIGADMDIKRVYTPPPIMGIDGDGYSTVDSAMESMGYAVSDEMLTVSDGYWTVVSIGIGYTPL